MSEETKEGFSQHLNEAINNSFMILGIGLGNKLGIFDLMKTFDSPKSSQEIAEAGGFKERYIREWLGQMTAAKVLDLGPDGKTFHLPEHRIEALSSLEFPVDYAGLCMFYGAFQPLAKCFIADGPKGIAFDGVPGADFEYLGSTYQENRLKYFTETVPKVHIPQVPDMLKDLGTGCKVLDVGCADGQLVATLAKAYPKSSFHGIDIEKEPIDNAQKTAQDQRLNNAAFSVESIFELPSDWTGMFDYVTAFEMLHNLPYPEKALSEMCRVLKPTGTLVVVNPNISTSMTENQSNPEALRLYTWSLYASLPMSLNSEGSAGLGMTMGKETVIQMCTKSGFKVIHLKVFEGDRVNFQCVCKK